jgi:hypothetical protein
MKWFSIARFLYLVFSVHPKIITKWFKIFSLYLVTSQNWLNLLREIDFWDIFLSMIATLTTNNSSQKGKTNIDPSPSLIDQGPHANNPFTVVLAFLAALSLKLTQFPRRIPASLSRRHIDCGLMFQRVCFLSLLEPRYFWSGPTGTETSVCRCRVRNEPAS